MIFSMLRTFLSFLANAGHFVADDGRSLGEARCDGGGEGVGVAGLAVRLQVVLRLVAALRNDDATGERHVAVAAAPDVDDGGLPGPLADAILQGVEGERPEEIGLAEADLRVHG
jgi:hypothetical protein